MAQKDKSGNVDLPSWFRDQLKLEFAAELELERDKMRGSVNLADGLISAFCDLCTKEGFDVQVSYLETRFGSPLVGSPLSEELARRTAKLYQRNRAEPVLASDTDSLRILFAFERICDIRWISKETDVRIPNELRQQLLDLVYDVLKDAMEQALSPVETGDRLLSELEQSSTEFGAVLASSLKKENSTANSRIDSLMRELDSRFFRRWNLDVWSAKGIVITDPMQQALPDFPVLVASRDTADWLVVRLERTGVLTCFDQLEEWDGSFEAAPNDPRPYLPKETFTKADWIQHPRFGVGRVIDAEAKRIRVKFIEAERVLVHGLG